MGLEENYKRAVIDLNYKTLPELTKAIQQFNTANPELKRCMDNLARALNNMPRTMRMRPG